MVEQKKKVAVIIGPTAVGKTKVSIEVAKKWNGEIISGDSMQVYRGLDIGTAKVTKTEMQGIPHDLIDIRNPDDPFTVADFQRLVRDKIEEISDRGKLPFIVGGTGLYIQSVLYDYQFEEKVETNTREQLEKQFEQKGIEPLYERLREVDPKSADAIHPNNTRRVIRALEVFMDTGELFSSRKIEPNRPPLYEAAFIGLMMERELLYNRINERVDQMIRDGLLAEVKGLYDQGLRDAQSVQAIGYKEFYDFFDGEISLTEAVQTLKKNSRQYAKRQLTWFRNQLPVHWFDMSDLHSLEKNIEEISQILAGKLELGANT